ncbi:quinone oxidoreductase family protein [Sphingomonas morindae]|uniref:Quinone oxidoreductase n=1 Tax=Sphingomonas morindae TaxID=1541170 RepID=A0ABY4XAB4_9SPHN|nr:quinone oxidoreductase [Sphingomonas morindae]USI73882.1 quinone oxidoreductase [Sphingomonas morindae]
MVATVRIKETGGPSVLLVEQFGEAMPGPRDVQIRQAAIGVNYLDVQQRTGAVPIPLPSGLGLEGAGTVSAIGSEVEGISVGDRVAYALGPIGAYSSSRIYPAERLIALPDTISFEDAAAVLFKGLTAQYLLKSTFPVTSGTVILLYGAAGAVGQLIASWAAHLGAQVIGVVSREGSVERAREAGCSDVLIWGRSEVPSEVARLTGGRMVDVVYDGVGRRTFQASLDSLRVRGTMVSFGASSGKPEPVDIDLLNKKSLFLTRPGLAAHVDDAHEYRARSRDVLDAVSRRIIKPNLWRAFPLNDVVDVHAMLDRGETEGAIILRP